MPPWTVVVFIMMYRRTHVFCYFFHNLRKLQNMHLYKITRDTNIKDLVITLYRSLAGLPSVPETYLFSKELVAYLETLITFSVYYRADELYIKTLASYKDILYAEVHKYIIRKLDHWYRLFPFKLKDNAAEGDAFSGEEGDIVDAPAGNTSIVGQSFNLSDGEELEDEAGVADEDILRDRDKEADNVSAVEANGAVADRAAVAAAGAGEVASAAAGCPRPKTRVVHGNEYTGLLNAVPMRACRQFGPHNLSK
jgi:hypothetical protein